MPATERMTADEFLALPEPLDARRMELVGGELVVHVPTYLYAEPEVPGRDAHRPYPVPQLAVEVRSPSTWRYDIGPKKSAYERTGLRELWLVDTAASEVLIFRRSVAGAASFDLALELERDHLLTSPQLDGFELPLVELFPE